MKLKTLFFLIAFALNSLAHGEQHSNDQETDEQIEKMQSLIEMQQKTLESMSISLPLLTNPIMSMVEKLQELNEKEFASVQKQTSDIEAKVEEAINFIETKKHISFFF